MNKKIMLLALAAVSAAVFALPAMASASEPLHLNPTPAGVQTIHGGTATLGDTSGSTVHCTSVTGGATFEAGGTTGSMNLLFHGCTEKSLGTSCKSTGGTTGTIATTTLPFHLVTLPGSEPGVLVTPSADKSFAHLECAGGLVKFTVEGNGVIGTIENECGEISDEALIDFNATNPHGVQEHTKVAGTSTEYRLKKGANNAAQDATGIVTFNEEVELDCT